MVVLVHEVFHFFILLLGSNVDHIIMGALLMRILHQNTIHKVWSEGLLCRPFLTSIVSVCVHDKIRQLLLDLYLLPPITESLRSQVLKDFFMLLVQCRKHPVCPRRALLERALHPKVLLRILKVSPASNGVILL
mmetsp:Transcript_27859/g.26900  ORF Transcript_27859/g.26900 Transcript_27859/m.26900 type:complete len:134 (-) Transcript_27859:992-1393(-)